MPKNCIPSIAAAVAAAFVLAAHAGIEPTVVETRTIELTQTITLKDVPAGAKQLRMWVPLPSDAQWQRVTHRKVLSAPGSWRLERQTDGRGEFLYVEVENPDPGTTTVVISATIERQGVHFPIEQAPTASSPIQHALFKEFLKKDAPLMEVNEQIQELADAICGDERDPARQAVMLLKAVAEQVNHYSKDPTVPSCGIGSAHNCLVQGGGCCTDLHALFIALARAREIPARIQFGYRALDSRAGREFDPSYRCWIEFFVPGVGWVPNDIVASDGANPSNPVLWGSLSAGRVWLWEGRSFELTPKNDAGPIDTMLVGWAEIDGEPVDVLPAEDGTPSRLTRTIKFDIVKRDRGTETVMLPE